MGNSSRRPASQPTGSATTSTSRGGLLTSFTKLSHQKLAPKQIISEGDLECPICFVTYLEYNTSVCCRQCICTECYIQMLGSSNLSCPFCGREGFNVAYDPTPNVFVTKDGADTPADPPTVARSASTSTPTSSPSTYVTPEQDKKLRSTSFDKSGTPVSSKADREALEAEIRRQRTDIEFEFLSQETRQHPHPTQRSVSTGNQSWHSSTNNTNNSTGRNRPNDLHRFNTTERSRSQSQQQSQSRRRESENRSRSMNPSLAASDSSVVPPMPPSPYLHQQQFLIDDEEVENSDFLTDDDAQLIVALQSILNGSEAVAVNPAMPSLEQLEEMMVLEAIRQSMRDAENANSNLATNVETLSDSATVVETGNSPSAIEPHLEGTNTSIAIPLPSPPSDESSSRLLEDIERALNTLPRTRQQDSNSSS